MCVTNVVVMVKFFILLLCVCVCVSVCVCLCVCVCVCDVVTQNGFFCAICRRMLKDRKALLQHINVDTHIGQIEVCILIRYDT